MKRRTNNNREKEGGDSDIDALYLEHGYFISGRHVLMLRLRSLAATGRERSAAYVILY